MIGKVVEVLVSEKGMGRDSHYRPVVIDAPIDSVVKVRIEEVGSYFLKGKLL